MSGVYDFFNGDADGIISLHQYRMFADINSELFTGVKRDVKLLRHCLDVKNSRFYVFDVSLLSNHDDVVTILGNGNQVIWFDSDKRLKFTALVRSKTNGNAPPDCS